MSRSTGIARSARLALVVVLVLAMGGCAAVREFIARPLGRWQNKGRIEGVTTIAVLPVAFRGPDDRYDCDLCPHGLVMAETSRDQARLVTGLFYEALSKESKFRVLPYDTVEAHLAATMDATAVNLTKSERIDAIVVAALLEMRPRSGPPNRPTARGGASIYAAMLSVPKGEALWTQLFDGTKGRPTWIVRQADRLIGLRDSAHPTEDEIAEYGVNRLVKSMSGATR